MELANLRLDMFYHYKLQLGGLSIVVNVLLTFSPSLCHLFLYLLLRLCLLPFIFSQLLRLSSWRHVEDQH